VLWLGTVWTACVQALVVFDLPHTPHRSKRLPAFLLPLGPPRRPARPLRRIRSPSQSPEPRARAQSPEQRARISYFAFTIRLSIFPHLVLTDIPCAFPSLRSFYYPYSHPYSHPQGYMSMSFFLRTMSAPAASLVPPFSHPQHPIEDESRDAVHRKRGRSLSTPSLNTREWHQSRMLDATTPLLGPCEPMPSGRPRSALLIPSPVITSAGPSLGGWSYEQVGSLRDPVEITEPSQSPATLPDEQVVATKEEESMGQGPEHRIKGTTRNAGLPPPTTNSSLESLLKRRSVPRCFFSLAELDAISSFEDFPDDGGY
jgi:hypothetical protein